MRTKKLKGTGVALVTPFTKNGEVDFNALGKIIEHVISGGVDYIVSLGTTGESATLDLSERKKILEFTAGQVGGRVGLVAGFGSNNTKTLTQEIRNFHFENFDAILSVGPYYNKPVQEGYYRHFMAGADVSPVPVFLYNVPSRTGSNITAQTTVRLANDHENIVAIKEASGDLEQCQAIVEQKPEDFLVISGDDALTLPLISLGFDGVISVIANAYPSEMFELVNAALTKDLATAQNLHFQMTEMFQLLFEEGNPAGVKCVMNEMRLCENELRLPMIPVTENLKVKLSNAMRLMALHSHIHST